MVGDHHAAPVGTGPPVLFRSDTPATCPVSGSIATPTAPGFYVITATQGGDGTFAPAPDVARAFRARAGSEPQTITFGQPAAAAVGQSVTLSAASVTTTSPPRQTGLTVSFRSDTPDAVHGLRLHRHPHYGRRLHHHRISGWQ